MATANGVLETDQITDSKLTGQGTLAVSDVRVLKKSPRVLSVAKLVAEGCEFLWNSRGAFLRMNNIWRELEVQQGVPLIALPAVVETTND